MPMANCRVYIRIVLTVLLTEISKNVREITNNK